MTIYSIISRLCKRTALAHALWIFSLPAASFAKDVHVVADTEGSAAKLQALVDQGKMKWVLKNGQKRLDFVNGTDQLVFTGDLSGPNWQNHDDPQNIFLREVFRDLKNSHPDRFDFIWGNHEANRFGFIRDNVLMEQGKHGPYANWLDENGFVDSVENRVQFWGKETYGVYDDGTAKPLADYQKELSRRAGKPVTLAEAGRAFSDDLKVGKTGEPHGKFLDLLLQGQESAYRNGYSFTHAPILPAAAGRTPLQTDIHSGGASWLKERNEKYFKAELEKFVADVRAGKVPSSILADTGDARWDSVARRVVNDANSLTYTERAMVGDNFTGVDNAVAKRLAADTKMPSHGLITGHKPAGNFATVHRQMVNGKPFFDIVADTSRGAQGASSLLSIAPDGRVQVSGTTAEGKPVSWFVDQNSDRHVGKVLEDGFHIKGETGDGKYILERYVGFNPEQKLVAKKDVDVKRAVFSVEDPLTNKIALAKQNALKTAIEAKGGQILSGTDEASRIVGDRFVLDMRGASKWAAVDEGNAGAISRQLKTLAKNLDPQDVVLLTGGNRAGPTAVESMVHDIFAGDKANKKFDIIGFMKNDTAADEVDKAVKYAVLVGSGDNWDGPVREAQKFVAERRGATVVWGGGGVLERSLDTPEAAAMKDRTFLMQGFGGASEKMAKNGVKAENVDEVLAGLRGRMRNSNLSSATDRVAARPRVGVYAGSFDPPHAGHQKIVEEMKKRYGLDKVYVVPDKVTAYKPGMMPLADREEMVRRMFKDPGIQVLPANATQSGELWDVLKAAQAADPKAKVYGIMGTDTFDWYRRQSAAKQNKGVNYLVNNRDGAGDLPTRFQRGKVELVNLGDAGYSSTKVRAAIARGESPAEVPEAVRKYIQEKNLYRTEAADASTSTAGSSRAVAKEQLVSDAATKKPSVHTFVKDQPVLAYRIKSDRFEDFPEAIRKHIGSVDQTKYTREYLQQNKGSVVALQMNGDKPDFYVIGKDTFDSKYAAAKIGDVAAKNGKYYDKLGQQIPELLKANDASLVAVLKTTPTQMIKASDLGYARDKPLTIESPWGEQTKPAGKEAYLVFDDSKKQYYMVNVGDDGNPLSYVPQNRAPAGLGDACTDGASAAIRAIANGL